ncbi:MAG TPA: tetratricopeptide repeat protein [Dongiaceae bacterium]|nr:tetratricopeptide repeat protein [Dongiaceae bacterium]
MEPLVERLRRLASGRLAPSLVAAIGFLTFAGTLGHQFVYDDARQIVENPWIADPAGWRHLVSRPVWAFTDERASNFYRPVQTLVHWTAAQVFGRGPFGCHLLSVLIHAGAAATLLIFLRRLTGALTAAAAAALFAVHPIHAEVVAWASAGPDAEVACALFLALTLGARALADRRLVPAAPLAAVAALPAYFAKETAVVAPLLAALLPDAGRPPARPGRRAAMVAVGFLLPLILYMAARAAALGAIRPEGSRAGMDAPAAIGTALALVPRYLVLAFVPWRMVPDRFVETVATPFAPEALAGAALLIVAAGLGWFLRRRAPVAAYGVALLLLPLGPALGVSWFASTPQADRYLYIPAAGACLLVALGLAALARRGPRARNAAAVAALLLVVAGMARAATAAAIWRDPMTLGRAGVALEPRSIPMRLELVHALDEAGRRDEALAEARAAAALAPADRRAAASVALLEARRAADTGGDAIAIYRQALADDPARAPLWVGLSAALLAAGRADEAIDAAGRALTIDRFNRAALVNLGTARGRTGDFAGQEREARRLLDIDPEAAAGWLNLGAALLGRDDYDGARAALERAARLDPDQSRLDLYLSFVLAKQGDRAASLAHARRATGRDPGDADAWNRLGAALAATGDREGARAAWEKTLSFQPGNAPALENLRRLDAAAGGGP